jgi:hypothetical protein
LTEKYGFDVIIDFASGLPTNDHIHYKVPPGTTVIYSDYDPITVEYGCEILGNTPNVYMFEGDARNPEELLNRAEVQKILGGKRKVALIYWGVSAFLDDEDITKAARALYDWADSGSCWVFNIQGLNRDDPTSMQVLEIYKNLGAPLRIRTQEEGQDLIHPWDLDEGGFIPLLEWHGLDQSELGEEDVQSFGPMGGGYGAYLFKDGD